MSSVVAQPSQVIFERGGRRPLQLLEDHGGARESYTPESDEETFLKMLGDEKGFDNDAIGDLVAAIQA